MAAGRGCPGPLWVAGQVGALHGELVGQAGARRIVAKACRPWLAQGNFPSQPLFFTIIFFHLLILVLVVLSTAS